MKELRNLATDVFLDVGWWAIRLCVKPTSRVKVMKKYADWVMAYIQGLR